MLYVAIILTIVIGAVGISNMWMKTHGANTSILLSPIRSFSETFSDPTTFALLRDALFLVAGYVLIDFLLSCLRHVIQKMRSMNEPKEEDPAWWKV